MTSVLILPGLTNSGPKHWQTLWEKQFNLKRALCASASDTESTNYPPEAKGFSPIPLIKLPFTSIVVASNNDPYVTIVRAQQFARAWGSNFVSIGEKGHINSNSNLGIWEQGLSLLAEISGDKKYLYS